MCQNEMDRLKRAALAVQLKLRRNDRSKPRQVLLAPRVSPRPHSAGHAPVFDSCKRHTRCHRPCSGQTFFDWFCTPRRQSWFRQLCTRIDGTKESSPLSVGVEAAARTPGGCRNGIRRKAHGKWIRPAVAKSLIVRKHSRNFSQIIP